MLSKIFVILFIVSVCSAVFTPKRCTLIGPSNKVYDLTPLIYDEHGESPHTHLIADQEGTIAAINFCHFVSQVTQSSCNNPENAGSCLYVNSVYTSGGRKSDDPFVEFIPEGSVLFIYDFRFNLFIFIV